MVLEVQLKAVELKYQGVETKAKEAEEKTISTKVIARAVKMEVA